MSGGNALVGERRELVGDALARKTFLLDSARSSMAGVVEAFARTFFLLIALKAFNAPKIDKSLIACAGGLGMLASPLLVSVVMRGRWRVSHAASIIVASGGALLVFPLLFHNLYVYVACAMGAIAVGDGIAVLMAPIHAANYPAGRRGKYVSGSLMVRVLSAAIAGYVIGGILKNDIGRWPLVVGFALATWLAQALLLWRIPSPVLALQPTDHSAARRRWNLVRDDAILRNVLISWMFMGVGNLMTIPLRVEYLSKTSYGISANAAKIAMLTVTVPAIVRLFLTPGFGWIFDRVDFFTVRILVNLAFAVSIGFGGRRLRNHRLAHNLMRFLRRWLFRAPLRGEDVRAAGEDVRSDVSHVLLGRGVVRFATWLVGAGRSLAEAGSLSLAHDGTA